MASTIRPFGGHPVCAFCVPVVITRYVDGAASRTGPDGWNTLLCPGCRQPREPCNCEHCRGRDPRYQWSPPEIAFWLEGAENPADSPLGALTFLVNDLTHRISPQGPREPVLFRAASKRPP